MQESTHPFISIIIPNYNYGRYISDTIESVLSQTYASFECIVVDDGSTDNSLEIIGNYCQKDHRVRLISKTNGGLPSTRNEGIKISKGAYIAFLDSDDLWVPQKLEKQVMFLTESPCDVVFSNSVFFNEREDLGLSVFQNRALTVYDFLALNPIPGCSSNLLIKKEVFEKAGLFDNDLRSSEDLEFLFRVAMHGFKFSNVPSVDVRIRKHSQSMQTNYLKMYINKMYCFDKCLQALLNSGVKIDKKAFNVAIEKRFQSMIWTARDCKRKDLVWYCYARTCQLIGFKFIFSKAFFKNSKYDFMVFLSGLKRKIFKA